MADARHRRPNRRRGLTLVPSTGRRRQSGVLGEAVRSPRELNRAARRASNRRATRRILLAALGSLLIVGAAVVASLIVLTAQDDTAGELPAAPETGTAVVMIVTDSAGSAASVGIIGAGQGYVSQLVLFPPALLTTIPGFGESELADVTRFGDDDVARYTLMNLLGIWTDGAVVVSVGEFAEVVGTALTVDLANPLVVREGSGEVVAAAAGPAERSPEELGRLLTTQGTSDQLAWLVRQGAVWEAVLDAAVADPAIVERLTAGVTGDHEAVQGAITGIINDPERQVVAASVTPVERPGGDVELYDLPGDAIRSLASVQFPYLRVGSDPRLRVEVLNGNGRIGTTQLVTQQLIEEGYWVVRTDNADAFTYDTTRVIAQGREHQEAALALQRLLTLGEVEVEQRQPSGVVDITIIVGGDLPSGSSDGP